MIVMEKGCHCTCAPMRPITSANLTSPCRLSDPQPSTVIVLPVIVAPAQPLNPDENSSILLPIDCASCQALLLQGSEESPSLQIIAQMTTDNVPGACHLSIACWISGAAEAAIELSAAPAGVLPARK